VLGKLDYIQYTVLKLATGAPSGTALNDLLAHTDEMPLAFARDEKHKITY
jgi:hypothetical protein